MLEPADPNPKAEGERAQQHEGLYSADARRRYDAAVELGKQPDVAAVPRLIELLADDGTTALLDEWVPLYEEEPEVGRVADAALAALRSMAASAWPALVAALPTAPAAVGGALLSILDHVPPEQRAAMPDDAHAGIIANAEQLGMPAEWITVARWERDFARRVRAHEFGNAEAFWAARAAEHPNEYRRADAVARLVDVARDQSALALQMVELLAARPSAVRNAAAHALCALPPVLPAETVRALAASEEPRRHLDLLPGLARYGEPAVALIPLCLDLLKPPHGIPGLNDDRQWRLASEALVLLGDTAAPARPVLIERFLTVDYDNPTLAYRPLRHYLVSALGDRDRLAQEVLPRLRAALDSDDFRQVARARDALRHLGTAA